MALPAPLPFRLRLHPRSAALRPLERVLELVGARLDAVDPPSEARLDLPPGAPLRLLPSERRLHRADL